MQSNGDLSIPKKHFPMPTVLLFDEKTPYS